MNTEHLTIALDLTVNNNGLREAKRESVILTLDKAKNGIWSLATHDLSSALSGFTAVNVNTCNHPKYSAVIFWESPKTSCDSLDSLALYFCKNPDKMSEILSEAKQDNRILALRHIREQTKASLDLANSFLKSVCSRNE